MPKVFEQYPLRSLVLLNLYETTALTYDRLMRQGAATKAQFFAKKYFDATGISPQDRWQIVEELNERAGLSS